MGRRVARPKTSWEEWEAICDTSRHAYQVLGRATWHRFPVPFQALGKAEQGAAFRAMRVAKGAPDWVLITRGVAILGDDKDCRGSRWPLAGLKQHQAEAFARWQAQGGLCCVLLRLGTERWVLPWARLSGPWSAWRAGDAGRGEASLSAEDCAKLGARWRGNDWLGPLLEGENGSM